ncbi:MAG: universal stress protein [Halobacteriaceae archaeon]
MQILVPIDGSDASFRALRFAADMARNFDGTLRVVHLSDEQTDATEEIVERAKEILADEGIASVPTVTTDVDLEFRPAKQVGEAILEMVAEEGDDHVVMGHHGAGAVERAMLGSATETVIRADEVPVTVVP